MSSRNLGRHFRFVTGTTPLQWLPTQRICHAQESLETADVTVDSIAAATGMDTAATLRRHFHRTVGVPPDTHRRTFRSRTLPGPYDDGHHHRPGDEAEKPHGALHGPVPPHGTGRVPPPGPCRRPMVRRGPGRRLRRTRRTGRTRC